MHRSSRALRRGSLSLSLLLLFQVVAVVIAPAAFAAPAISSCTPTSGPVGTQVTITGSDLTGVDRVEFGGVDQNTYTVNPAGTQISVAVPSGAVDGPVTVTANGPDGGTASCPSNFDVTPTLTPTITSFTPTSGPVGTSVVITGTNFTGTTAVRFNGISATFTVNSPTQITATVPTGATDGPIAVENSAGTGTSSTNFDVTVQPAPTITSFSPASGAPGTSVVITGTNFTGATAVRFAGTTATYTVNSPTQITAVVPSGASTGAISVTTPTGTATSSSSFTVTAAAPSITSFSPASGCVGSTVTLTGTGFSGATAVTFNGITAASFTVSSATRITAVVPTGATTGKIAVTGPTGTSTSATNFTVTQCAPTIVSFTPANGPIGTSVVITGDDFTGTVTVKFDGVNAAFTVNSDSQITATVPTGATTGRITITNGIGTGTSSTDFIVTSQPTITSFTPAVGPAGSTVTINGTNFTGTTAVRFNGVATATFTVNSATRITATVPSGATTGKITVTNSAGSATSATDFTVAPVPQITGFSPAFGRVGTEVTITGSDFTGATDVRFNGVSASFSIESSTEIVAIVPTGATDGPVSVVGVNGTGTSSNSFVVTDVHARSVTLRLSGHLRAEGNVIAADDFQGCEDGITVRIQRRRAGVWRTLKLVLTDAEGHFETNLRDRRGLYRARAIKLSNEQDVCRRATSPRKRHTH